MTVVDRTRELQASASQVRQPELLVLRSTTHIPPGWDTRYGVRFTWTWCFSLTELAGGRTRLHLRVRGRGEPWWFIALYVAGIVPADFVMATGMLCGLRRRAEHALEPIVSGRPRPDEPWRST